MADEKKRTRRPNGASSIYQGKDGKWHGRVTVGVKDDGSPDRRHVERKTHAEIITAVRELEKLREQGTVPKAGKPWTVKAWLTHWLENITPPPAVRASTHSAYAVAVNRHLIPGIGRHRLNRLEPEHLERLYTTMQREKGLSPATAHQAHRTVRIALAEAQRRGHVARNVAALAKAPRIGEQEVDPYSVAEIQRLLEAALKERNSARWAIALALGLRQGEALGLKWKDADLDTGTLRVRRNRVRPKYKHGCAGDCGRKYPGYCPDRGRINEDTDETKSRAGKRVIGLPDALVDLLKMHREQQDTEREAAGNWWTDGGWLFATEYGEPLNPRSDWDRWKELLEAAKVRDGRLHDARHTAATVLLLLGVPERLVMAIMGWSSTTMAARYQHVTDGMRRTVAEQVGGLIWQTPDSPETGSEKAK